MKLHFFDIAPHNFGDALNPWLWSRLLPDMLDDDEHVRFVGIGTLINHRLDPAQPTIILGTGTGLGQIPRPSPQWRIYGVRGPRSARALRLDASLSLVDPAMAVRDLYKPKSEKRRGIGFMPHYESLSHWDWEKTAQDLGLIFIDPRWDVERVMEAIAGVERLISEAMHGAIVADALRTPWTGLAIAPGFHAAKWHDWGEAIGVRPRLARISPLYDMNRHMSLGMRWRSRIKRAAITIGCNASHWTPPPPRDSNARQIESTMKNLTHVISHAPAQLSHETALDRALMRFEAARQKLCADWQQGHFSAPAHQPAVI